MIVEYVWVQITSNGDELTSEEYIPFPVLAFRAAADMGISANNCNRECVLKRVS